MKTWHKRLLVGVILHHRVTSASIYKSSNSVTEKERTKHFNHNNGDLIIETISVWICSVLVSLLAHVDVLKKAVTQCHGKHSINTSACTQSLCVRFFTRPCRHMSFSTVASCRASCYATASKMTIRSSSYHPKKDFTELFSSVTWLQNRLLHKILKGS